MGAFRYDPEPYVQGSYVGLGQGLLDTQRGMRLLVVLPFCEKDQKLLIGLLKWIHELGGCMDNDCALVFSKNTNRDLVHEVVAEASLCFKNVKQIPTPHINR